jgi:SAM-dependent methyltransferase
VSPGVEVACFLDKPAREGIVQRHGFTIEGWIYSATRQIRAVTVSAQGVRIGATSLFFARPDVNEILGIDAASRTGFVVDCIVPNLMRHQPNLYIIVEGVDADGGRIVVHERLLTYSLYDYRYGAHGYQFDEAFTEPAPRDVIYATGPPAPEASGEVVNLLTRYLEPATKVLDVGCGIGAFGRAFRERGLPWTGCEVRHDFVDIARADGLDVRLVEDGRLPFADATFDAAFAIEVLEHIRDPHPFLREMARVAPRAGYFSVPNFESIPVTSSFYAIPWHMLEPDHWVFYAHGSLKATLERHYREVEVFEYGELPLLRALDGLPVFNHLFAIGRNP